MPNFSSWYGDSGSETKVTMWHGLFETREELKERYTSFN